MDIYEKAIKITDTIKQTSLTFTISTVMNPINTLPTSSFRFESYDESSLLMCKSDDSQIYNYTPLPRSLEDVEVLRLDD